MGGKPRRFTDEEELVIASEYLTGTGAPTLARRHNSNHATIYKALRRQGVAIRHFNELPLRSGGRWSDRQGYMWVRVYPDDGVVWEMVGTRKGKTYPYVHEHRAVMARLLGRPLRKGEEVHHKNGQRDDNRPENLQMMMGSHGRGVALQCNACGSVDINAMDLQIDEMLEQLAPNLLQVGS